MRTGEQIYLDLGCAFAQDIRRLVADGVDSRKCYGADLRLDFIELGYDLFRDKDTLESKFIDADIFDESSPLKDVEGTLDIINASAFFHLFNWDDQKKVAIRVAKLMKPQRGSLLVGKHVGSQNPQERPSCSGMGRRYSHNIETWRQLWNEVGNETGSQFQVDGETTPISETFLQTGYVILQFSVRRV